ncbi:MAG: hypothetical protein ACYS9T_06260 [Planctomycetota bacterium]|jgi:hypothetical protein
MAFNRIFRVFIIIVIAWMIGCGVFFLCGMVTIYFGAPSWLPLPWSDFDDFVQSSDGKVFVDIGLYSRVLCYDENGTFIASCPYRFGGAKDVGLAVDDHGHVFFRTQHLLYTYDTSWNLLEEAEGEFYSDRHWRLGQDGKPVIATVDVKYPRVPDRVAKPGELIFSKTYKRTTFTCMDGTRLIRVRNHLNRYSTEGELVGQYSEPWLLSIFTFPWPAALAWPLGFLFAYIEIRRRFLLKEESNTLNTVRERLLVDTSITAVIFIIAAAAIVIGGSVVMFIANALPKSNPMHLWLVPLVVIPYWIAVVITALWAWRRLLRSLDKTRPANNTGNTNANGRIGKRDTTDEE